MIQLVDNIWIGDSSDEHKVWSSSDPGVAAVLNVALDLYGRSGWPTVEYMQVGLIDGPGNPLAAYYAAALALSTLARRHEARPVLVCCHTGGRALAVAIMHLNATAARGWNEWMELIRRGDDPGIDHIPVPHAAHRAAFDKMNWRLSALARE